MPFVTGKIAEFTMVVDGNTIGPKEGESSLARVDCTAEVECELLPNPEDPYGLDMLSLLFWHLGVMSYPWLFRN